MLRILAALIPAALMAAVPKVELSLSFNLDALVLPRIVSDSNNNIVIAGHTRACTLPVVKPLSTCGSLWIGKFDASGTNLVFATYLGSSPVFSLAGLAADRQGNIVIAGTARDNLMPVNNALQPGLRGEADAYVLKLAGDGQTIFFGTYVGGVGAEVANSMALDSNGAIFVRMAMLSTSVIARLSGDGRSLQMSDNFDAYFVAPLSVDSDGTIVTPDYDAVFRLGGSLEISRTALPQWAVGKLPTLHPLGAGAMWLTGTIYNGLLPTTNDAFKPVSGIVPYSRIEDGVAVPPATAMNAHQIEEIAADPKEPFRLYSATEAGLFRSEDNGWTWDLLTKTPAKSVVVDPFDQNTIYAGSAGMVLSSRDRGQTWQALARRFGNSETLLLTADRNVQGLIYAAAGTFVYASDDGGMTWRGREIPQPPVDISPSATLRTGAVRILADPQKPKRLFVLTTTQCLGFCPVGISLWMSEDAGGSFVQISDLNYTDAAQRSLAADLKTGTIYYLTGGVLTIFPNGDIDSPVLRLAADAISIAADTVRAGAYYQAGKDGALSYARDRSTVLRTVTTLPGPAVQLLVTDGGVVQAGLNVASQDAYAFKYDSGGNLIYGTYFGDGNTQLSASALGPDGKLFLAGENNKGAGFIAVFDAAGSLAQSYDLPAIPRTISAQPDGSLFVTGETKEPALFNLRPTILSPGSTFALRIRP